MRQLKKTSEQVLLLERTDLPALNDPQHPTGSTNFYRRDDVSATAYFYLNKPASNLPGLADAALRMQGMRERGWAKAQRKP